MKTPAAKIVLRLMDEDRSYLEALIEALKKYPETNRKQLEKELSKYI